jgi:hypothetical protein
MADVRVTYHGSITLVEPVTDAAREWIDDKVCDEQTWFGGKLAVEARYVENLLWGMSEDGLEIE